MPKNAHEIAPLQSTARLVDNGLSIIRVTPEDPRKGAWFLERFQRLQWANLTGVDPRTLAVSLAGQDFGAEPAFDLTDRLTNPVAFGQPAVVRAEMLVPTISTGENSYSKEELSELTAMKKVIGFGFSDIKDIGNLKAASIDNLVVDPEMRIRDIGYVMLRNLLVDFAPDMKTTARCFEVDTAYQEFLESLRFSAVTRETAKHYGHDVGVIAYSGPKVATLTKALDRVFPQIISAAAG